MPHTGFVGLEQGLAEVTDGSAWRQPEVRVKRRSILPMERFAGNTDGCELFTDGIGDRVPMVAEQNERISGRNFHTENLQEVIVLGEMVMRLLIPGNDNASLRKSGNGKRHIDASHAALVFKCCPMFCSQSMAHRVSAQLVAQVLYKQ